MTLGVEHMLPHWLSDDAADVTNARVFCVHAQEPRLIGELLDAETLEPEEIAFGRPPNGQALCRVTWLDRAARPHSFVALLVRAIGQHEAVRGEIG